ncbi:hypothetical protein ACFB49_16670 [Sphingomonas sp. DBB INV C78]
MVAGLLAVIGSILIAAMPAMAQDDGARLYMLIPDKTTITSVRYHRMHSNLAVDPGNIAEGDHLDTDLVVFQFVQTLKIAGGQSSVFFVLPVSRIEPDFVQPGPDAVDKVSGLGDAQLGFVLGVHGTPALELAAYADHPPGLAVNLLGKIFFPTGKYSAGRSINVGANRWALRLGVPMVYAIGDRMADPHLTTIEIMPTVTFFGRNDDPFGADSSKQKPLFILEGHLTRGVTPDFWASLDLLWRRGGEGTVDGVDADNFQRALSLGATGTFALAKNASLRVSYGGVVDRNAHGPNGWIFRTILGFTF